MNEFKELMTNNSGFVVSALASSIFITYIVDVSKGLSNIIYLGDPTV